ncbi:hypothetical protein GWK47_030248 [Chionoecetes opilio]|uniref:Uncharacterized protein n=1 Tax=Chionoecetes opilio TaxID=41210 RepID=A0A8J5D2N0_CHIOP|nr:hypothetical protein GWK47_030248 [Chionoecetes opilio]
MSSRLAGVHQSALTSPFKRSRTLPSLTDPTTPPTPTVFTTKKLPVLRCSALKKPRLMWEHPAKTTRDHPAQRASLGEESLPFRVLASHRPDGWPRPSTPEDHALSMTRWRYRGELAGIPRVAFLCGLPKNGRGEDSLQQPRTTGLSLSEEVCAMGGVGRGRGPAGPLLVPFENLIGLAIFMTPQPRGRRGRGRGGEVSFDPQESRRPPSKTPKQFKGRFALLLSAVDAGLKKSNPRPATDPFLERGPEKWNTDCVSRREEAGWCPEGHERLAERGIAPIQRFLATRAKENGQPVPLKLARPHESWKFQAPANLRKDDRSGLEGSHSAPALKAARLSGLPERHVRFYKPSGKVSVATGLSGTMGQRQQALPENF